MFSLDFFKGLTKRLFPSSISFINVNGGWLDKLYLGLAKGEKRFIDDAVGLYDSIFPDNDNFTIEDADNWEKKLGIMSRDGVSLSDRKMAIAMKLNHPHSEAPRQHYLYIQEQLRAAGFDVYVYENTSNQSPESILSSVGSTFHSPDLEHSENVYHKGLNPQGAFHAINVQHGNIQHGSRFNNIVANSLDRESDSLFVFRNNNYKSTFFIAGANFPDFAEIPRSREIEFRQLLLQLKPVQTIGFLFLNYY